MVILSKIYTRTGDSGETSLGNGERRSKDDLRVTSYGLSDTLNSSLGLVRLHLQNLLLGFGSSRDLSTLLSFDGNLLLDRLLLVQNDLFDLGADLCFPRLRDDILESKSLRMTLLDIERLESWIDFYNKDLSSLKSFILPGGTLLSCYLHNSRTSARTLERSLVSLSRREELGKYVLIYVNRLSDLLFVWSRCVNSSGELDILWQPGKCGKRGKL